MERLRVEGLALVGRLQPISFSVQAGAMIGVIGPNGSGKSTLLHGLAGLWSDQGSVLIEGNPIQSLSPGARGRTIGLLPQTTASAWSLSVRDVVRLGRLPWGDENCLAINEALVATGMTRLAERPIHQLSGGEQARAWLARVIAGTPKIMLVDEPVAHLDLLHQQTLMRCLSNQAKQGTAVVIALHDLSLAARFCDRLILLNDGQRVAIGTPHEVLQAERLSTTYGVDIAVDLARDPPVILAR